jgi:hypothetical protein
MSNICKLKIAKNWDFGKIYKCIQNIQVYISIVTEDYAKLRTKFNTKYQEMNVRSTKSTNVDKLFLNVVELDVNKH